MVVVAQADDPKRILYRRPELDLIPLEYETLAGNAEIRTAAALGMIEGSRRALPGALAAPQERDAVGGNDGRRQGLTTGLPLPGEQILIGIVQIDDPLIRDHRPEAILPFGILIHHDFHDILLYLPFGGVTSSPACFLRAYSFRKRSEASWICLLTRVS